MGAEMKPNIPAPVPMEVDPPLVDQIANLNPSISNATELPPTAVVAAGIAAMPATTVASSAKTESDLFAADLLQQATSNNKMPNFSQPAAPAIQLQQQQQQSKVSSSPLLNNANNLPIMSSSANINNNNNNNNDNNMKLSNINQFIDPLEHSLASLEQPQLNLQKAPDLNLFMQQQQQQMQLNLMNQMQQQQQQPSHVSNANNAFVGAEFNNVNGLINMLGINPVEPSNLQLLNQQMKQTAARFPDVWNVPGVNAPPSLQPLAPNAAAVAAAAAVMQSSKNTVVPNWEQQQQQQSVLKQQDTTPKLTPKPIEELLDFKTKPLSVPSDVRVNTAFGQTFKYEQNLKNPNSWSQLASAESLNTSSKSKLPSQDTFQEFRTKAKEQQQRQKQEAEKMKKLKEQELKRQQAQENLQKQTKMDESSNGQR